MAEQRKRSVSLAVWLLAAVVVALGTRSRARPTMTHQQPPAPPAPPPVAETPVPTRRTMPVLASLAAATAAGLTHGQALPVAGTVAIVALTVAAAALLATPTRPAFAVHAAVALLALYLTGTLIADPADAGDVSTVLLQALFGVVAVGVLAWVATRSSMGPLVEPTALVLVAAILAWQSLQGIGTLTAPIDTRQTNPSRAALFVSDPSVHLDWTIKLGPDFRSIWMVISTPKVPVRDDFRWAVVLMGTAQIVDLTVTSRREMQVIALPPIEPDVLSERELPEGAPAQQIVSGGLDRFGQGRFSGQPIVPLAVHASSRTAVLTPGYGRMNPNDLSPRQRDVVTAALGGPPAEPLGMNVSLDAGYAGPFQSVESAIPRIAGPRHLAWGTDDAWNPVMFVLFDQQAEDRARNQLFVIAILLGTAASCLVAALQSALRPSRRRPS